MHIRLYVAGYSSKLPFRDDDDELRMVNARCYLPVLTYCPEVGKREIPGAAWGSRGEVQGEISASRDFQVVCLSIHLCSFATEVRIRVHTCAIEDKMFEIELHIMFSKIKEFFWLLIRRVFQFAIYADGIAEFREGLSFRYVALAQSYLHTKSRKRIL